MRPCLVLWCFCLAFEFCVSVSCLRVRTVVGTCLLLFSSHRQLPIHSSNSKFKTHNTPFSIQEQLRIKTQHNICKTGKNIYVKHINVFEPCHTDNKFQKLVHNGCYYIIFNPSLLSTRYTTCNNQQKQILRPHEGPLLVYKMCVRCTNSVFQQ